jgi:hypothetical protein
MVTRLTAPCWREGRPKNGQPDQRELSIFAVALEQQGRRAPNVDLRDHRRTLSRIGTWHNEFGFLQMFLRERSDWFT